MRIAGGNQAQVYQVYRPVFEVHYFEIDKAKYFYLTGVYEPLPLCKNEVTLPAK